MSYSSRNQWGHDNQGNFGHYTRHSMGDRDVSHCSPDIDNSMGCCGCVRKGPYPCEYESVGGTPPPIIEKCFQDPADWDNDGSSCLKESSAGCCPAPDFNDIRWSRATLDAFNKMGIEPGVKQDWWEQTLTNEPNKKGTCMPSVEGGMCKYTTDDGLSLFYNYVDGTYENYEGVLQNTRDQRNSGMNVKKLLNYPMLNADSDRREPPMYTNLCDVNNWNEADSLFHQITTEAGRNFYIDDYRERANQNRLESIGRQYQERITDEGGDRGGNRGYRATGEMMEMESILGDMGLFGGGPSSLTDIRPIWNQEEGDNTRDMISDDVASLEERVEEGILYGFTVPDNSMPGDRIRVRIPSGTLVQFTLPDNAVVGSNIKFRVNE